MNSTTQHYNRAAEAYVKRTIDIDMSISYNAFLQHLQSGAHILDGGCGPGRDTKYFLSLGYQVTAFDLSEEFVKISSAYTGQKTLHLGFHEIDFDEEFHAIWTSASLLHIPSKELGEVLSKLKKALKPNGIWYLSFKYGDFEGYEGDRYFTFLNESSLKHLVEQVGGLEILGLWQDESHDQGDQIWLRALLRKN